MCIVDQVSFAACNHNSYFLLFPCASGFSVFQKHCNANSHIVRKCLDSTNSYGTTDDTYCQTCYHSTIKTIRTDYAKRYLDIEKDARSLGWSKADIQGSLAEMQSEMKEAVSEWKVSCDQEDERDEQALDVYAESIRFQFGPHPAVDDELTQPGTPYCFRAGTPDKLSFPVCRQTYSRYLPLMKKRKAGKQAVRKSLFPHDYSMIQTRRVSKCGRRRSSQFKNVGRV